MAKFKGAVKSCQHCDKEFKVPACRADSAHYCSKECADNYRGATLKKPKVKVVCQQCGKEEWTFPCFEKSRKFCSYECYYEFMKTDPEQANRVAGEKNPMWKGGVVDHTSGYFYECASDHPFSSNGYVLQHRLVVERYLREHLPSLEYLVEIDGVQYLRPECVVHHIDHNRKNNDLGNLMLFRNDSEHQKHHNVIRRTQKEIPI